ncbi:hypothetical protein DFH08DRAFT_944281 [Mycena albidolilacea]|uniref:Cullin family profile domain-containing protein n=1 Tax=Mycena albidolilacea TaxID=1033008 RepID=A0AAD6Z6U0_9AGAR|nr:hypothetical protein DFH08DRAFT_944281 [Mycena albidolilacea]
MAFLRMDGWMYRRDSTLQLCQPDVYMTWLCSIHPQKAETLQDEALLQYYAAEWDCYTTGANYLHRPFTYLARQGKKGVYQVYTLALAQWRQHLFAPLQPPLTSAILHLVAAQRDGASIDQALVAHVRPSRAHPRGPPAQIRSTRQGRRDRRRLRAAPAAFAEKGASDKEKDRGERKAGELDPRCTSAARLLERADMLLRKSNEVAGDADLEGALNWAMVLFKYLEDKNVFQTFYTTKLSKRLIHVVSASDEAAASTISKLKEASSCVPGTNFWPLAPPTRDFLLPPELLPTVKRFTRYYQTKHSGRKLTWLQERAADKLHEPEVHTNAVGGSVLLQYNGNDTLSLTELQEATNFSPEILGQVLALLVKAKVLINEEKDRYDLNPGFKSKKIRVNLNLPIKVDVKAESSGVLKVVDEDRKYVIQVTVVRITKARKTMKNQALIQEVISQISQCLMPKIPDIKKAIETLLEDIDISVSHVALYYGLRLRPRLALSVSCRRVSPVFSLEGLFLHLLPLPAPSPVSKVIPKMLVTLRSPAKADRQVSVRSPSRLEISVAAANLVFNPDDSWDTAEITSPPNAPVVVERPRPETRPLARKNLVTELLRKQQDAAADKAAMIQVLEATERRIQEAAKAAAESVEHRLAEVERKLTEERVQRRVGDQQILEHIVRLRREQINTSVMLIPEQDVVEVHESLSRSIQGTHQAAQCAAAHIGPKQYAQARAHRCPQGSLDEGTGARQTSGERIRGGRELRNIQQHKRPDTATALERTSIATDMPPDLYQILEDVLASDPRCLKVGSEREWNTPEVDLRLFAPEGTYISVGQMREDLVTMRRELEELEERLAKEKATGDA